MENEKQIGRLRLADARINGLSVEFGIPIDDTNEHITYYENQEFLTTKEEE